MPALQEQTVRGFVQDASVKFSNQDYIGDRVAPIKDGVSKLAKITKYRAGDSFRDEAGVRAPGAEAKRGDFQLESVNINPLQYAFASEVRDEDRQAQSEMNLVPPVDLQQDAVEYSADKIDLKKEKRVSAIIKATTWADGNASGEDVGGLWAPGANNTFLKDIREGKKLVQSKTGMIPNSLVLDYGTFELLREELSVSNKIKNVMIDVMTPALLASLLNIKEVLIGTAIENVAPEANGTDAFDPLNIWETNAGKGGAFLFYKPASFGLKSASALGQFRTKMSNGQGRLTSAWREPSKHQWVYESAEDTDIVAIHANLGVQFIDTILD